MKLLKVIGIVVKVEYNSSHHLHKIFINLTLPQISKYEAESKQSIKQLLETNSKMDTKLSSISYGDDITHIKIYKPFYSNREKNIIVAFAIPKDLSNVVGLSKLNVENLYGVMVKIKAVPIMYNFTDKKDNKTKIKGWKLKTKSIFKI